MIDQRAERTELTQDWVVDPPPRRPPAEAGGLIAYGGDLSEVGRRMADDVHEILNGTKPGDIPIYQPAKYELVINLKAAKALDLTLPPTLLAAADEVIE